MNTIENDDPDCSGPEFGLAFILAALISAPLWLSLCVLLAEVLQ